jgi:hypothetical protein
MRFHHRALKAYHHGMDSMKPADGVCAVSLFDAVREAGLDAGPVLSRAVGARALDLLDLGPALSAVGFAYASPRARHEAARLLAVIEAGFAGAVTLGGPASGTEAEAAGVAPLPALVIADEAGRRLSRVVELAVPPELFVAARLCLLGHGHLPGWLALAPADHAAITAALPRATSLAHAAALAGRLAAIAALDEDRRGEANAFIFGEPVPPRFLPEPIALALVPGADAAAIAAMASAVAPFLAAPPFCPAPLVAISARRRRPAVSPAALPLFADAPAALELRAVS